MLRRFTPALFFALISAIFFLPVIFGGKTFFPFDYLFQLPPWSGLGENIVINNTLISDPILGFYPPHFYISHYYYQSGLASGTVPLWFNLNFCGTFFIPYSSPVAYFFYSFFPLTAGHDGLLMLHLFGIGMITYLYLRQIGISRLASGIGGICWMFNGYVMVWFEFEHVPMLAATLPLTLLFLERFYQRKTTLNFLGTAGAVALAISVSYAHLVLLQMLFVCAYIAGLFFRRLRSEGEGIGNNGRFMISVLAALAVGTIISTHFFTSHFLLKQQGQRTPYGFEELYEKTGKVGFHRLATLVFPDFFGNPVTKTHIGPPPRGVRVYNNYNELCMYAGVFSIFLVLGLVPDIRRRRGAPFFLAAALICLAMAMGSRLYYPLWRFVPGLNLSTPTRILYLFGFSLSMLAAMGADIVFSGDARRKWLTGAIWTAGLATAIGIAVFVQTDAGIRWAATVEGRSLPRGAIEAIRPYFAIGHRVLLIQLLMAALSVFILVLALASDSRRRRTFLLFVGAVLLVCDLLPFGRIYNTASPKDMEFPKTPGIEFLKKQPGKFRIMGIKPIMPHSFVSFGIEDVGGYGSFYPRRYGEYLYLARYGPKAPMPEKFSRWIFFDPHISPLIDLVNTRFYLTPRRLQLKNPQLELVYKGEMNIYENRKVFPRAFFVPKFRIAGSKEEAYKMTGQFSREDFTKTVILESPPEFRKKKSVGLEGGGSYTHADCEISSYSMNRIEIDVDSPSSGLLVVGDNYAPGWRSFVDGEPTKVLRANYIMRAVPLSAGHHKVILEYRPWLLIAGLVTTWIGWSAFFVAVVAAIWFERKRRSEGTHRIMAD